MRARAGRNSPSPVRTLAASTCALGIRKPWASSRVKRWGEREGRGYLPRRGVGSPSLSAVDGRAGRFGGVVSSGRGRRVRVGLTAGRCRPSGLRGIALPMAIPTRAGLLFLVSFGAIVAGPGCGNSGEPDKSTSDGGARADAAPGSNVGPTACTGTCSGCEAVECLCKDGSTQADCTCETDDNDNLVCGNSSECGGLHVCDSHGGSAAASGGDAGQEGGTKADSGSGSKDGGGDAAGPTGCPYISTLNDGCRTQACGDAVGPHAHAPSDPVLCTKPCDMTTSAVQCTLPYSCIPIGGAGTTDGECLLGCETDEDCTAHGLSTCTENENPDSYCVP